MRRAILLVAALSLALAQSGDARVRLIRPPAIVRERQPIQLQVRISPHPENRYLIVAAGDDLGSVRESHEALPGEDAPRTRYILWRDGLPPGSFQLIAALYGSSGKEISRATASIQVIGMGP